LAYCTRDVAMQEDFGLVMLGRVPVAHRLQMRRGCSRQNVDALHGQEPRIAHGRSVCSFPIALCQLRQIDFIENRKTAQFRDWVSCRHADAGENRQDEGEETALSHADTSNGTLPGCKS